MNIDIGSEGTEVRYKGVIKIDVPLPPGTEKIVFNLIAPDGQSVAIGQRIDKANRDSINYHISKSINGIAFIAFPKHKVMVVWSATDIESAAAMKELLTMSIEDQEKFVSDMDQNLI